MKSKVLRTIDLGTVDIQPMLKPFVRDDAALERELRRIVNPYVRWETGTAVISGGQVVCRLKSACDRFNRDKVRFVAGSGLFHREMEALSVGMAVGETRETDLPEGRVALTVTEILNRVVPEPDDGMVQKLDLEGVRTLEDYRAYLLAQQKEKFLEEALWEPVHYLRDRVLEESEFVLFKEDWREAVERKLERCRVLFRQEGLVMEELAPEQFAGRIPVKSYHELVAMVQDDEWDVLQMHLLGKHYAQADGFTVTEADYGAYIADYVKTWGDTEAEAREIDPYDSFVFNEYANHAYGVMQQYVRTLF